MSLNQRDKNKAGKSWNYNTEQLQLLSVCYKNQMNLQLLFIAGSFSDVWYIS